MNQGLEFIAALILAVWSVWRVVRVAKSLRQHGGRISVGHARALLWPGLILVAVLGWFIVQT
jgi:hypothetical protein